MHQHAPEDMISRAKFGQGDAMSGSLLHECPKFERHGSSDDPKQDTPELSVDEMEEGRP